MRGRLARLNEVSLGIAGSLEIETVLQAVIDGSRLLTGARYGAIWTFDDSGATCPGNCSGSRIRFGGATKLDYRLFHQGVDGLPRHYPKHTSGYGTLTITPIADGIVEETESILITGSAPGLGASTATVLLTDSTVGHGSGGGGGAIVSIAPPSGETSEGSIAELTVSLSHSVAAAVTVAFHVTPGTADASDYTEPALSTVTFPANSAAGATQTIAVATNQDLLSEGAESFTVTLGTVTGDLAPRVSVDPDRAAATATIAESDPISISLSGPAEADEGAEATYTVSLSPSGVIPTRELTVTYATSDGTALAGSDYAPATGTLSFTQDSPGAKTFTVSTTEDILTEARETFTVSIAVTYSTSDGTALAGSDYASAPGTISSTQESAGDRIVTVGTAGNTATESGETSSASSSGPAGDGGPAPTLGTYSVTTTIADDDEPVPAAAATPTPTREPAGGPASTPRPTQTPQPTWGHLREPVPTPTPTPEPTREPTPTPTPEPTSTPAPEPTREATPTPTPEPTPRPAQEPTREPTPTPTPTPEPAVPLVQQLADTPTPVPTVTPRLTPVPTSAPVQPVAKSIDPGTPTPTASQAPPDIPLSWLTPWPWLLLLLAVLIALAIAAERRRRRRARSLSIAVGREALEND